MMGVENANTQTLVPFKDTIKLYFGSLPVDLPIEWQRCDKVENPRANAVLDCRLMREFPPQTVHEMEVVYLVSHFGKHEIIPIFQEWYRVLVPGGCVDIEDVDGVEACKWFLESDDMDRFDRVYPFYWFLTGCEGFVPDPHQWLPTKTRVEEWLRMVGFQTVWQNRDMMRRPWWPTMRVRAVKPV